MKLRGVLFVGLIGCFIGCDAMADDSAWRQWFGEQGPTSLYLGMWTYHLMPRSGEEDNPDNFLVALTYKGIFAGTFLDSFNHRNYAAGIQRYWYQKPLGHDFDYYLGYRLGLVYGYGDHIINLNGLTPVLPFMQLISSVTWKHFGVEVSYTGIVVSAELYIKF